MRASGILLPVSSLPSKYGIGCFSAEAYEFVDQLARAGQKYWQILPLGPGVEVRVMWIMRRFIIPDSVS